MWSSIIASLFSSAGNGHGPASTCKTRLCTGWHFAILSLSPQSANQCQHHISTHAMSGGGDTEDPHTDHYIWTLAQACGKSEMHSVAVGRVRQGLKLKLQWRDEFTSHRILLFLLKKKRKNSLPLSFHLTSVQGKLCVRKSPTPCCTFEPSHAFTLLAAEPTEWKIHWERCFPAVPNNGVAVSVEGQEQTQAFEWKNDSNVRQCMENP